MRTTSPAGGTARRGRPAAARARPGRGRRGVADGDRRADAAEPAIAAQTAAVLAAPKLQVRDQRAFFEVAGRIPPSTAVAATGRGRPGLPIRPPAAQPIGACGPQHEPAIEDDQVVAAARPVQRRTRRTAYRSMRYNSGSSFGPRRSRRLPGCRSAWTTPASCIRARNRPRAAASRWRTRACRCGVE